MAHAELERQQVPGRKDAGNGRLARNLMEEAVRRQASRLAAEGATGGAEDWLLLPADFGAAQAAAPFDLCYG